MFIRRNLCWYINIMHETNWKADQTAEKGSYLLSFSLAPEEG